jgi:hypothetical protein
MENVYTYKINLKSHLRLLIQYRVITIVVFIFQPFIINAQTQNSSFVKKHFGKVEYDTAFVSSHYRDLHITGVSVLRSHRINVYDYQSKNRLKFAPNNALTFGFGIDWRVLTFEFARAIPGLEQNDTLEKGITEGTSLRFGLTGRRFLASCLLQAYRGFYVKNPSPNYPGWSGSGYPIREDLTSVILHGSLYYNFNPQRYSFMAQLWQIDRQLKSAGSWIAGLTININSLTSDSTIVKGPVSRETGKYVPIRSTVSGLIGFNVGYGYNWVFREKYFVSGLLLPGVNVQSASVEQVNDVVIQSESRIGFHGDFRIIAGYNGPLWYTGVHFSDYFVSSSLPKTVNLNQNNVYLRFFIGRRLLLPSKH